MRIKNWGKFQHYGKYRTGMPWIKIYRKLLDDPEWFSLSPGAIRLLVNCWLLASERNGELPPMKDIAFRLRMKLEEVKELITELDHWLEDDASTMLADCYQDASTDRDRDRDKRKKVYEIEGTVVRLTKADHSLWLKTFSALDLNAELAARDAYLSTRPEEERRNWFKSTAAYLRNRQLELKGKKKVPMVGVQFKSPIQDVAKPDLATRERQLAAWGRTKHEMVCGDDQKPKRRPSAETVNGAGLRHVLSTLPQVDHSEEDEATGGGQAVPN